MQIRVRPLLGAAAVWSAGVGGTAIAAGPRTARLLVDEFDPTSFKRGPASGKNGSTMTIEAARLPASSSRKSLSLSASSRGSMAYAHHQQID
jgi:hypothetical protein